MAVQSGITFKELLSPGSQPDAAALLYKDLLSTCLTHKLHPLHRAFSRLLAFNVDASLGFVSSPYSFSSMLNTASLGVWVCFPSQPHFLLSPLSWSVHRPSQGKNVLPCLASPLRFTKPYPALGDRLIPLRSRYVSEVVVAISIFSKKLSIQDG